jgi:hypothetical protein
MRVLVTMFTWEDTWIEFACLTEILADLLQIAHVSIKNLKAIPGISDWPNEPGKF